MHLLIKTAALAAALLLAAPAVAETRTIELEPFTALDISSGIDATVAVGASQAVTAEATDPRLLEDLQVRVENGTLKAYFDWSIFDFFDFGVDRRIKLTITAPALDKVTASAGSDVDAAGITGDSLTFSASSGADLRLADIRGKAVSLEASAGSNLEIEGTCETGEANASAGSDIEADRLQCATMDANASSGSDLDVFASRSVKANASSGSDLTVHGNPAEVEQESSSGAGVSIE